jgi:hypothetical protein
MILALLELFLALGSLSSILVDRRELARAVYNYHQQRLDCCLPQTKTRAESTQGRPLKTMLH